MSLRFRGVGVNADFDHAGNLYGVTNEGGSTCPPPGCGTIFQLSPGSGGAWTETVIYGFNGTNGATPVGSVIIDAKGNLYGTAAYGGSGTCDLFGYNVGCGVVYELSPPTQKSGQWMYTVLYNFQGGNDGLFPWGNLVLDRHGNLYGATRYGGGKGTTCNLYFGGNCGTVFELTPPKQKGGAWTEQILHSFAGGTKGKQIGDGADPNGGLIFDGKGAIYSLVPALMIDDAPAKEWSTLHSFSSDNSVSLIHIERILREHPKRSARRIA